VKWTRDERLAVAVSWTREQQSIRHEGSRWCVYSADGTRKFGCFPSKAQAEKRLAQIEHFKRLAQNGPPWMLLSIRQRSFTSLPRGLPAHARITRKRGGHIVAVAGESTKGTGEIAARVLRKAPTFERALEIAHDLSQRAGRRTLILGEAEARIGYDEARPVLLDLIPDTSS
jgi:hypothetical protein